MSNMVFTMSLFFMITDLFICLATNRNPRVRLSSVLKVCSSGYIVVQDISKDESYPVFYYVQHDDDRFVNLSELPEGVRLSLNYYVSFISVFECYSNPSVLNIYISKKKTNFKKEV